MAKTQPSLIPHWLILLFQCLVIYWDNNIKCGILFREILVRNGKCLKNNPYPFSFYFNSRRQGLVITGDQYIHARF